MHRSKFVEKTKTFLSNLLEQELKRSGKCPACLRELDKTDNEHGPTCTIAELLNASVP